MEQLHNCSAFYSVYLRPNSILDQRSPPAMRPSKSSAMPTQLHTWDVLSRTHFILSVALIFCANFLSVNAASSDFDFSQRPANQSARLGERVTLKCATPPSHTKFDAQSQWRTNTGALLSFHNAGVLPGYGGRYSYAKDAPGELYFHIDNVTLADDGKFECQMLRPPNKFLRASAFVNILVPPTSVSFVDQPVGQPLVVQEGAILNITCFSGVAKPPPELSVFVSGKRVTDAVQQWTQPLENGTANAYSSLIWRPSKNDHNKLLSCEASHSSTGVNLRNAIALNVLYSSDRPKIDVLSADSRLKAGTNVTLLCSAEGGNPRPRLLWANEAGLINSTYEYDETTQTTRNALTFTVHGTDNEAVYECNSANREDVAPLKKSVTLTVYYAPTAVYLYGSTTARKGESVVISCLSSASFPPSKIEWTVNGSPTRSQPHTHKKQAHGHVTGSNITIDSNVLLSGQNQIVVECAASNGEGPPASNQHVVRVLSPSSTPVIYEPIEHGSLTLLEGGLLNLTCESQGGHPLATLNWYRGVEKLKEAYSNNQGDVSRSVVSVPLDRSMNRQQIRCEAENGATDQPLVAKKTITVLFPPKHVQVHQMSGAHHQMVADVTTQLTCHVPSSNPPAEITWEFENQTPAGGPTSKVAKSGQYTKLSNVPNGEYKGFEVENVIQFEPTEEMDKSVVRCIASNPQWTDIKTSSFTLDVMYPPRVVVEGPITVVVGEDESFEENLTVHCNPQPSNFQWRKNGVVVERSIGNVFVRGSTIGGTAMAKEDAGVYTLNIANRIGTTNVSLRLTVEYSARVTYITSPVVAGVGENVVLECEADGMPLRPGMVRWMRGETEFKSVVQDQKRAVLRINASHDNSGLYTCVADNGVGRPNTSAAYLLVRRAPIILRTPEFDRASGPLGGRATLKCAAVGVPSVKFLWNIHEEGRMILNSTTKYKFGESQLDYSTYQGTLTIINLEERDYARRYSCQAFNELGRTDKTYISVGPPSAPDVPIDLQVTNVTDSTVSLAWLPAFNGGFSQIFELRYQAAGGSDVKFVNSSGSRIMITGLDTEQTYVVQIRSINARGLASDFSTPSLRFRTLDENMQAVYRITAENIVSALGPSTMAAVLLFIIVLILLNTLLVCVCKRRHQRKKYEDKTEIARTLGKGVGRGIQIYGTVDRCGGDAIGTPMLSTNRRPDSTTTNKSELLHDGPLSADDNQSARTIIEVHPNGYIVANSQNIYDSNCVVDYDATQDYYSPINKPIMNGTTYASVPYPEPPHGDGISNTLMFATPQNNGSRLTLKRSPAPHRHLFGNSGYTALPTSEPTNNNNDNGDTLLFFVGQNGIPGGNYVTVSGANYVYNPQTNSLTLTNGGDLSANGYEDKHGAATMSYELLKRNYPSATCLNDANGHPTGDGGIGNGSLTRNGSGGQPARTLATFSPGNPSGGYDLPKQHLLLKSDGIEGDIV